MNIWIFICGIETIIIVLMTKRLLKEKRSIQTINNRLKSVVGENRKEIQSQNYKLEEFQLSLKNAFNANEFINKLNRKPTYYHKQYIRVYQKELSYLTKTQVVYAVFYEDDYIYSMKYLEEKSADFDINRDVSSFGLKCLVFIDGEQLDPSLNSHITQDSDSVKIEELNMHKHEGKGGGKYLS